MLEEATAGDEKLTEEEESCQIELRQMHAAYEGEEGSVVGIR